MSDAATDPVVICAGCGSPLKLAATFCGACGHRRVAAAMPDSSLGTVIAFYIVMLLVSAAGMIYGKVTENFFTTFAGTTIVFGIVTLGFAVAQRPLLAGVLGTPGFSVAGYALILVASVAIVAVVAGYVHAVNALFGIHVDGDLAVFGGRSAAWTILLLVILPPLEEELAFRGLIFGGLRQTLSVTEALVVSAFAFAMLHLSIPTLVTHLPLGLYFGWLRYRSKSLWPGVFAHACHNLGVAVLAWTGLTG